MRFGETPLPGLIGPDSTRSPSGLDRLSRTPEYQAKQRLTQLDKTTRVVAFTSAQTLVDEWQDQARQDKKLNRRDQPRQISPEVKLVGAWLGILAVATLTWLTAQEQSTGLGGMAFVQDLTLPGAECTAIRVVGLNLNPHETRVTVDPVTGTDPAQTVIFSSHALFPPDSPLLQFCPQEPGEVRPTEFDVTTTNATGQQLKGEVALNFRP